MVGTERFSKSLAAPSKWPIAKSRSALSAQRVRSSETRLIAPAWISTARRLHSNMPKTSAARNPGPPLLSSCRCHRLVSVSRFLFKLVFSGSDYFRIADHPGETRLSGTPAATTRCLHDRRDCARVPPHPAASHVARPVGGGNPRPERHGRGSARNHGRSKMGCELLLWQTHRGGDLLVSRIGCKWLEVGLDLHDDQ